MWKIDGECGGTNVDVVEIVGDKFSSSSVAVVVVQRVVALHDGSGTVVVACAVVESVVACAANKSRGLQLTSVSGKTTYKDIASVGVVDVSVVFGIEKTEVGKFLSAFECALVGVFCCGKVVRTCGPENDELVERIDVHAVRHVGLVSAQVGCVDAGGSGLVELEDSNVGVAIVAVVVSAQRGWESNVEYQAGGVGVFVGVVSGCGAPVVGG